MSVIILCGQRLLATSDSQTKGILVMMGDFCRMNSPVVEDFPQVVFDATHLNFPRGFNCVAVMLNAAANDLYWGDRVAIRTEFEVTWTYRALREASNRIANMLVCDDGLVPGNHVLLDGTSHPILAVAWFGAIEAGLSSGLARALQDQQGVGCVWIYETSGRGFPERWLRDYSASFTAMTTRACNPCVIAFISGTTGQPKATVHFHRDVTAVCRCFPEQVLKPTEDDVFCSPSPLALGLGSPLLFPVSVGASVALLHNATLSRLLAAIIAHWDCILICVPTGYRADGHDVSSLRKCVFAGEALPIATREAWCKRIGIHMVDGNGSMEVLHIFAPSHDGPSKEGRSARRCPVIVSPFWTTTAGTCHRMGSDIWPCWDLPATDIWAICCNGNTGSAAGTWRATSRIWTTTVI
ncbi:AMP-binding protein [Burkholderia stabilis]|uniref:AMP-binding protein n=1 Tax=Burkholderia stabilis TaxID=95485 RepID=UPI001F0B9620|nr:AMP-binding protein [Burkholderia stabilis]